MESDSDYSFPAKCSSLRVKGHVMLKGHPCKIVEMNTSAPGKHGHAKISFVGIDIFTQKKIVDNAPATHTIRVPYVTRKDYNLVFITSDGEYLALMVDGEINTDFKIPGGELGDKITKAFKGGEKVMCTVLQSCGDEVIVAMKTMK